MTPSSSVLGLLGPAGPSNCTSFRACSTTGQSSIRTRKSPTARHRTSRDLSLGWAMTAEPTAVSYPMMNGSRTSPDVSIQIALSRRNSDSPSIPFSRP
jgi:hypothetical protein